MLDKMEAAETKSKSKKTGKKAKVSKNKDSVKSPSPTLKPGSTFEIAELNLSKEKAKEVLDYTFEIAELNLSKEKAKEVLDYVLNTHWKWVNRSSEFFTVDREELILKVEVITYNRNKDTVANVIVMTPNSHYSHKDRVDNLGFGKVGALWGTASESFNSESVIREVAPRYNLLLINDGEVVDSEFFGANFVNGVEVADCVIINSIFSKDGIGGVINLNAVQGEGLFSVDSCYVEDSKIIRSPISNLKVLDSDIQNSFICNEEKLKGYGRFLVSSVLKEVFISNSRITANRLTISNSLIRRADIEVETAEITVNGEINNLFAVGGKLNIHSLFDILNLSDGFNHPVFLIRKDSNGFKLHLPLWALDSEIREKLALSLEMDNNISRSEIEQLIRGIKLTHSNFDLSNQNSIFSNSFIRLLVQSIHSRIKISNLLREGISFGMEVGKISVDGGYVKKAPPF